MEDLGLTEPSIYWLARIKKWSIFDKSPNPFPFYVK